MRPETPELTVKAEWKLKLFNADKIWVVKLIKSSHFTVQDDSI